MTHTSFGKGQFTSSSKAAVAIPDLKMTMMNHRQALVRVILDTEPFGEDDHVYLSINGKWIKQEPKNVRITFFDGSVLEGFGFDTIVDASFGVHVYEVMATAGIYGDQRAMMVEEI